MTDDEITGEIRAGSRISPVVTGTGVGHAAAAVVAAMALGGGAGLPGLPFSLGGLLGGKARRDKAPPPTASQLRARETALAQAEAKRQRIRLRNLRLAERARGRR